MPTLLTVFATDNLNGMKSIFTIALLFAGVSANAQSPVGFWEAVRVTVGDKVMTPIGKWTRINGDGTYQSGNGWLQNSAGTWTLDDVNKSYLPVETKGLHDVYGAFAIAFDIDNMIWKRQEDGLSVVVTWQPINNLPRTPADLIVGMWEVVPEKVNSSQVDISDVKKSMFIRWDRIYVAWNTSNEKRYGYWFMNAHRPELAFIDMAGNTASEKWRVQISGDTLTLEGLSDDNKGSFIQYRRVDRLPGED